MRRLLLVLLLIALSAVVVRGQVPCDVLASQPSCDVALLPGPTRNTLDIVTIDGEATYTSAGQLRLTTVAVDSNLGFLEWVRAMFSSVDDTVDRSLIYPEGTSEEDVAEQNDLLMETSQLDAEVAGLVAAGYDADELYQGARIVEIADEHTAEGVEALSVDDVVVAVDGQPVDTASEAVDAVAGRSPGDEIVLTLADGTDVPLVATSRPDDPDRALLGILLQDEVDFPFAIDIDAGNIGGPSAGLMFALGIVDLLGPDDLTGGRTIAGTGTITVDGPGRSHRGHPPEDRRGDQPARRGRRSRRGLPRPARQLRRGADRGGVARRAADPRRHDRRRHQRTEGPGPGRGPGGGGRARALTGRACRPSRSRGPQAPLS